MKSDFGLQRIRVGLYSYQSSDTQPWSDIAARRLVAKATLMEVEMAQSVLKGLKLVVVQKAKWARDADPVNRRRDELCSKLHSSG